MTLEQIRQVAREASDATSFEVDAGPAEGFSGNDTVCDLADYRRLTRPYRDPVGLVSERSISSHAWTAGLGSLYRFPSESRVSPNHPRGSA